MAVGQEYLTFSDLAGLQSSPSDVRSAFKDQYDGVTPSGLALNDSTYYDAVQPPITQQYGHYCYKTVTDYEFGPSENESSQVASVGSNIAKNDGDTEAEIDLTVTGDWTEEIGWSSTVTPGLTYSKEFTVEGAFKMGLAFSIGVTAGKSGSSSTPKSSSSTVTVKVPPHSQVEVIMVVTMKKERLPFEAPITVSGMMGANFPERVREHCFWFSDIQSLVPWTSGMINGVIDGTAMFDPYTVISPAAPLA